MKIKHTDIIIKYDYNVKCRLCKKKVVEPDKKYTTRCINAELCLICGKELEKDFYYGGKFDTYFNNLYEERYCKWRCKKCRT